MLYGNLHRYDKSYFYGDKKTCAAYAKGSKVSTPTEQPEKAPVVSLSKGGTIKRWYNQKKNNINYGDNIKKGKVDNGEARKRRLDLHLTAFKPALIISLAKSANQQQSIFWCQKLEMMCIVTILTVKNFEYVL